MILMFFIFITQNYTKLDKYHGDTSYSVKINFKLIERIENNFKISLECEKAINLGVM